MYIDSRTMEQGADIEADVCIVGAGAAGITTASELSGLPVRVALIESGGFEFEDETQELMRGEVRRGIEDQLITSRIRFFGGTTNVWGGECLPLSAIDFEKRDGVPLSGWPMTRADLDPFYKRAHGVLKIGDYEYDTDTVAAKLGLPLFPFDRTRVDTAVSRHRAMRFGEDYHETLEQSENVRVYLYGNLVNINRDPGNAAVKDLSVKTLTGKAFTVRSKMYVLALGGIENARMLLLSRDVDTAGIGNGHDKVGRYFMEHLSHISGYIVPADSSKVYRFYTDDQEGDGEYDLSAKLGLPEKRVRELKIPNYRAVLTLASNPSMTQAKDAAREVYADVSAGEWPDDLLGHIGDAVGGMVDYAGDWVSGNDGVFYRVRSFVEQVPNPDSRVGLVEERDALGLNRAFLDWRLTQTDRQGIAEGAKAIAMEVGRSGFGRFRMSFSTIEDILPDGAHGAHHHMGTTRMHENPKQGVVDPDCRVHGVGNLFVAGSSVFPTCGHANPTLTIVALSLRLADRIKAEMGA